MKAAVFAETGTPQDRLQLQDVEVPAPHEGEALVRVDARPIQPADFMFIEGRYRIKPALPQIAGLEGTGTVVSSGSPTRFPAGSRVAFRHPGTWAELAAVPEDRLYVVPEGIDAEQAGQFSLNPVTAWALLDELQAQTGDWIGINAATSNVAQLVHALCRRRRIHVVGIVAGDRALPPGFPSVRADTASVCDAVLALTGGHLLAGLLDSVGGTAITGMLHTLRPGATIVSFAVLATDPALIKNSDIIYRNLTWKGFGIDHWLAKSTEQRARMERELWTAIASGELRLPVRSRYGLQEIHAALAEAATPGPVGKILIVG
jgi:NADPH:quinone reductase-like Zn-dependent oxidoreductase